MANPLKNQEHGKAIILRNANQQKDSLFFRLPAELRNMVYEHLFFNEVDIRYCTVGKRNAGIILACRLTHHETLTLYHTHSPFVSFGDDFTLNWLRTIPFERVRQISELRCDVTLAAWGNFWGSEEAHKAEQFSRMKEFMFELLQEGVVFREGVVKCRMAGCDEEGREVWKEWSQMR